MFKLEEEINLSFSILILKKVWIIIDQESDYFIKIYLYILIKTHIKFIKFQ